MLTIKPCLAVIKPLWFYYHKDLGAVTQSSRPSFTGSFANKQSGHVNQTENDYLLLDVIGCTNISPSGRSGFQHARLHLEHNYQPRSEN